MPENEITIDAGTYTCHNFPDDKIIVKKQITNLLTLQKLAGIVDNKVLSCSYSTEGCPNDCQIKILRDKLVPIINRRF